MSEIDKRIGVKNIEGEGFIQLDTKVLLFSCIIYEYEYNCWERKIVSEDKGSTYLVVIKDNNILSVTGLENDCIIGLEPRKIWNYFFEEITTVTPKF